MTTKACLRLSVSVLVVVLAVAVAPAADEQGAAGLSFERTYALGAGDAIRRLPPPFHAERLAFLRREGVTEDRADHLAAGMIVRWRDGRPSIWGRKSASVPWYTLGDLVGHFVGVSRWELEGERELIDMMLPGDFVIDRRATAEQFRSAMERIASDVTGKSVKLEFREVERPVLVLKGRWRYTPVAERRGRDEPPTLELYAGPELTRPPEEGGEAAGSIDQAAGAISQFLGRRVLIECDGAPPRLQVRRDDFAPGTADAKAKLDEALVLRRLEEQTGLRAVEERRQVRRMFVTQRGSDAAGAQP